MKRNTIIAAVTAAALLAAPVLPAAGAPGAPGGPKTVGTDDEGDWGANTALAGTPAQAAGGPTGQDLVEAQIGMADAKTINFVIKVASLPPIGGVPEGVRYVWSVDVGGEFVELDGKFTNYSRGACDPTSGQCPPPRNPGMQPFLVRGNCRADPNASNVTLCDELGIVQAEFSTGDGTITIPVPLELVGAKPGTKIAPATSQFTSLIGGSLVSVPSAFLSLTGFPADALIVDKTFKVPGGKKKSRKKK
ncbi:MAG TPA: hypothetical protein VM784_05420 [Actinomycetota bacterium]|nr:hypothetical protein [Actinomycetota bacterium]